MNTMTGWQRANVQAAAALLRELISNGALDARTVKAYEGLLEVLEPTRRAVRLQRENATASAASAATPVARERRKGDRRQGDRRVIDLGSPTGVERRRGGDRRQGGDRRGRG